MAINAITTPAAHTALPVISMVSQVINDLDHKIIDHIVGKEKTYRRRKKKFNPPVPDPHPLSKEVRTH